MWSGLKNVLCELKRHMYSAVLLTKSIDVSYIQLIDGIVEFNYDLIDFLLAESVYF